MAEKILSTKNSLRKSIKNLVKELNEEDRETQNRQVSLKLINKINELKPKNVLSFMPLKDEIDISFFNEYLFNNGINVFVPVTYDNSNMFFYRLTDMNNLSLGQCGISEPNERIPYINDVSDVIIVPGVGFDKKCNRLGRGKGYYDVFLNSNKKYSIGVSYNEQITDFIATEKHDYVLDEIITSDFDYKKIIDMG